MALQYLNTYTEEFKQSVIKIDNSVLLKKFLSWTKMTRLQVQSNELPVTTACIKLLQAKMQESAKTQPLPV
jgi:hypothetical protein